MLHFFVRNKAVNFVKCSVTLQTARHASYRVVSFEVPKPMNLTTPRRLSLESIFTPELGEMQKIFQRHGYELRIAGGAVRDLLSDKVPTDLDFATTATPVQMKDMFETENIRMINKRGEQHGTITCRINDKVALYSFFSNTTEMRLDVIMLLWFCNCDRKCMRSTEVITDTTDRNY